PPLPLRPWLPTMAALCTAQGPPDLFLLARLWPLLALTCQPLSVLPSKIDTQPLSLSSGLSLSAPSVGRAARGMAASSSAGKSSRRMAALRSGTGRDAGGKIPPRPAPRPRFPRPKPRRGPTPRAHHPTQVVDRRHSVGPRKDWDGGAAAVGQAGVFPAFVGTSAGRPCGGPVNAAELRPHFFPG